MSIINDPYKSFKDQAQRIWDTKDFAERLAFSTMGWVQAIILTFLFVTWIHFFVWIAINDLFTLADFYSGDSFWYINVFQKLWDQTSILQLLLLFFWTCPRIMRFGLTFWKGFNSKEMGFLNWIERRIKLRFPEFKTSAQRSRERVDKTPKPNRLQRWIRSQPPMQRRFIRFGIASSWGILMFFLLINMINPDILTWIITGEKPVREVPPEPTLDLENQPIPNKPDNQPPPTIYDIFIKQSNSVIP